jgi:trans-AT polyketide synthase/acyltransferase/oxidoreductase domain-containing protein
MTSALMTIGRWIPESLPPLFAPDDLALAAHRFREPLHIIADPARPRIGVASGGQIGAGEGPGYPLLASLPPLHPEWLGDRSFGEAHGVRFPYVVGAMANGITTTRMVKAAAGAGIIGFFGAGGLGLPQIEAAIAELAAELGAARPWGANLIHNPHEPDLEAATVELYLRAGVTRASASAFMGLTAPLVRYAAAGLWVDAAGRIQRRHHVFAKISRPEVARHFLLPAPEKFLRALVEAGQLTADEAALAAHVPLAEDVTVEADSGGHTDNQPLPALFPVIARLRDTIAQERAYDRPIRVGAAGGLGTPSAVAAAFGMGAAYVLTGSVNQAAVESGLSAEGRQMLAAAGLADVAMAAAADMFELGVKLQVLKRGTLFAGRANRLYEAYQRHPSLDAIPADERARLEREVLGATLDQVQAETRAFWARRDPRENLRADRDPRHLMALCFRWYLGQSSRWAIAGEPARRLDYQIWCGPAMGAFNDWVRGSFLEDPARREVVQIAANLLEGAAAITRAQQLRAWGAPVPPAAFYFHPRPLRLG